MNIGIEIDNLISNLNRNSIYKDLFYKLNIKNIKGDNN